ncbi:hypothetical protein FB570_12186 [Streptomyces sp. T12]|nr:hypothetical protein FB570_12186 [Streptomyces sp. T12]
MSRWFANPDAIAAPHDVEWAPWVRYTRMPPVYDAPGTKEVAAYAPEEQALNSAVHDRARGPLHGCGPPDQQQHPSLTGLMATAAAAITVPPLCFPRLRNGAAGLRGRHDCVPLSKA